MTMLDCLIIGGGPAGLTAAVYLARYRRSLRLIDSGQSRARLIPNSHNYPGFKGVGGEELLQRLREQALEYDVPLEHGAVEELRHDPSGGFHARTGKRWFQTRTVILATGIVDKEPPFTCSGGDPRDVIRYCPICDGYEAMDRRVAVLGGEEAAKKAVFIRTFTKNVQWFSDDSGCPASYEACGVVLACAGRAEHIETSRSGVRIVTADGASHDLDLLYPALGCDVRSGLATALGARCSAIGTLIVDAHQRTSVEGLYAIGDVVSDLHQIAVATGHAAVAATAVHNWLPRNPR
jgi:thioredoxin reductase (NADPH)